MNKKKFRLTKIFHFEMAHALHHYQGLCRNIHGHSYQLDVTIKGEISTKENSSTVGMVMDFSELKKIVQDFIINQFDHSLVLNVATSNEMIEILKQQYEKVVIVNYQPTSENLVLQFVDIISKHLPDNVKLYAIKLKETETSFVEWFAEDE